MRPALRLLAKVRPGQYLEAYSNTGITGLFTHPAPRPTLVHLYRNTLDKLRELPESSVYRQSAEALTKHRLGIVESIKPDGFEEWNTKAQEYLERDPSIAVQAEKDYISYTQLEYRKSDVVDREDFDGDERDVATEGGYAPQAKLTPQNAERLLQNQQRRTEQKEIPWEPEPPLSAEQISEIESKIGAGLIEEVIQVADGELKLADEMAKAKPWEELEEKPREGQWTYFERGTHTTQTQKP